VRLSGVDGIAVQPFLVVAISRFAVNAANIQHALRRIETQALKQAGIDLLRVGRQPAGDGAVLALPGDVSNQLITTRFVEALREVPVSYGSCGEPSGAAL
jgi:hypothetical protein